MLYSSFLEVCICRFLVSSCTDGQVAKLPVVESCRCWSPGWGPMHGTAVSASGLVGQRGLRGVPSRNPAEGPFLLTNE